MIATDPSLLSTFAQDGRDLAEAQRIANRLRPNLDNFWSAEELKRMLDKASQQLGEIIAKKNN